MFSWLIGDALYETLIYIAIIVAIALILIFLIKEKNARPFMIALFCIVWTFGGVYCGFTCYHYYSKETTTIGTYESHDPYEDFNIFEYDLGNIVFYPNSDGTYSYSTSYGVSYEFDGTDKNYEILINNSPCYNTDATAGQIYGDLILRFYDTSGEFINSIDIKISLVFYTSHINMSIDTSATSDTIGLLQEYVAINGFAIRIIEPSVSVTV